MSTYQSLTGKRDTALSMFRNISNRRTPEAVIMRQISCHDGVEGIERGMAWYVAGARMSVGVPTLYRCVHFPTY